MPKVDMSDKLEQGTLRKPIRFQIEYFSILMYLEAKDVQIKLYTKMKKDEDGYTQKEGKIPRKTKSKFKIEYQNALQNCICTYVVDTQDNILYKSEYCIDQLSTELRLVFSTVQELFDFISKKHDTEIIKITKNAHIVIDYPDLSTEDEIKINNYREKIRNFDFEQKWNEVMAIYEQNLDKEKEKEIKTTVENYQLNHNNQEDGGKKIVEPAEQRSPIEPIEPIIVLSSSNNFQNSHHQPEDSVNDQESKSEEEEDRQDDEDQNNQENENEKDKVILEHIDSSHQRLKFQLEQNAQKQGQFQEKNNLNIKDPAYEGSISDKIVDLISSVDNLKTTFTEFGQIKQIILEMQEKINELVASSSKQEFSLSKIEKAQNQLSQLYQELNSQFQERIKSSKMKPSMKNQHQKNRRSSTSKYGDTPSNSSQVPKSSEISENESEQLNAFNESGWPGSLQMYRQEFIQSLRKKYSMKNQEDLEKICIFNWRKLPTKVRDQYERRFAKKITDFFLKTKTTLDIDDSPKVRQNDQKQTKPIKSLRKEETYQEKAYRRSKKDAKMQKIEMKKGKKVKND